MIRIIKTFATNLREVLPFVGNQQAYGIGRRLLFSVLFISSLFVLIQTSLQLKWNYDSGIEDIEQMFSQIELGYKDSLTKSLWEMHIEQLKSSAIGIQQMPGVISVEIYESVRNITSGSYDNITLTSTGERPNSNFVTRDIPIKFDGSAIGNLRIFITLEDLYSELFHQFIFIIIFQIIKTLLVSIFILATFNYLVTRHLTLMANFSRATNLGNLDELLELDRDEYSRPDELSLMVKALNDTKRNLKKLFESEQTAVKLEVELEKNAEKVILQKNHRHLMEQKNEVLEKQNNRLATTINTLKVTQQKLVNSEKMAALGGMVQGVAHELNTPLGLSITGVSHIETETHGLIAKLSANQMKKSDLDNYLSTASDMSSSISASLAQAASLIRSFKMLSPEEHQELISTFDLHENLEDVCSSLRRKLQEKNIIISHNLPAKTQATSYPGILFQVYSNLISNSVLHAFEHIDGGEITIKFNRVNDLYYSISFTDNGCGMDDDTLKNIYQPFFTTKRANGGTGLGMNIIYTLISEKLKGEIHVESALDKGTTFTMSLPFDSAQQHLTEIIGEETLQP
ncbi:MAG: ATP-binding protein [Oceanospirillaceae bacterium]|nr:ATP-binding protein [Oceanospirillaceae bacterium]